MYRCYSYRASIGGHIYVYTYIYIYIYRYVLYRAYGGIVEVEWKRKWKLGLNSNSE